MALITCVDCGEEFQARDMYEIHNGEHVCEECKDNNYAPCHDCNELHERSDMTFIDGLDKYVCEDCIDDNWTRCADCGEYVRDNDAYSVVGGNEVCCDCRDNYSECNACGDVIRTDDGFWDRRDDFYCGSCRDDGRGAFRGRAIEDYNYRPTPQFNGKGNTFFGIELEIDKGGESEEIARKVVEMLPFTYCKHDGSLNQGFEIVTHPCSYKFHYDNKAKYEEAFKYLVDKGYQSHNTDTCGLHIHVSKKAFGEGLEQELNLAKLLYLFEAHFEKFEKLSRRKKDKLERWAKRKHLKKNEHALDVLGKYKNDGDRYVAINLRNEHTVEFRIFRGTLNVDTFMATLQLVKTIVNNAIRFNVLKLQNVSWEQLTRSKFVELNNYMEKHFPTPTEEDERKKKEILAKLQLDRDANGYKVGDKVFIKQDITSLNNLDTDGIMVTYQGKMMTIVSKNSFAKGYRMKEDDERFFWNTHFIDGLADIEMTDLANEDEI